MGALVQDQLCRFSGLFKRLHHQIRLADSDVEVVESVHDEGGALDVLPVIRIV